MEYQEYEDLLAESQLTPSIDYLLGYEDDSLGRELDLEGLLTESRQQEQKRIDTELCQIERRLNQRTRIHENVVADLEEAIRNEKQRLNRLQRPFPPKDRIINQERYIRDLKQKLQEIRQAHWRDREQLERERRGLCRELAELRDTDLSVFF